MVDKNKIYENVVKRYEEVDRLFEHGERDLAIDKYLDLLVIYIENDLAEVEAFELMDPFKNRFFIFRNVFNVAGALKVLTLAKRVYEKRKESHKIVDMRCCLGLLYIDLFDYGNAKENLRAAEEMAKEINYIEGQVEALNMLGRSDFRLDHHEEAYAYINKGYKLALEHDYAIGKRLAHNLAEIHLKKGEYEQALVYLKKAESGAMKEMTPLVLGNTYAGMSRAYLGMKNFEMASVYIEKAIELSMKHKNKYAKIEVYETLAAISEGKGDFESAYKYVKERNAIARMFDVKKGRKEINRINTKYQVNDDIGGDELIRIKNLELETMSEQLKKTNLVLEDTLADNLKTQEELVNKNEEIQASFKKLEAAQEQLTNAQKLETISKLAYDIGDEMVGPLNLIKAGLVHYKEEMENTYIKTINGELKRNELKHFFDSGFKVMETSGKNLKRVEMYVSRLKQDPNSPIEMEELKVDVGKNAENVLKTMDDRLNAQKCVATIKTSGDISVRASGIFITSLFEHLINSALNYGFKTPYNNSMVFLITEAHEKVHIRYSDSGAIIEKEEIEIALSQHSPRASEEYSNRSYDLSKIYEHVTNFLMGDMACYSNEEEGTVVEITLPKFTKSKGMKQ